MIAYTPGMSGSVSASEQQHNSPEHENFGEGGVVMNVVMLMLC